eukprot:5413026-Pyramimonas_sp.AAC.1
MKPMPTPTSDSASTGRRPIVSLSCGHSASAKIIPKGYALVRYLSQPLHLVPSAMPQPSCQTRQ